MKSELTGGRLFIDGGGIRGYSSLRILSRLMEMVAEENAKQDKLFLGTAKDEIKFISKPCDYFHHMVGTSTGG